MPRYIVKLSKDGVDKYLDWSTIVDAPITYGMSLEDFKAYYKEEYGTLHFEHELPARLERVEKHGCSAFDYNVADMIQGNRAGDDESELTFDQLWDKYCSGEGNG